MNGPLILSLDNHGVPHRWISWQQACFYYAKNLVAWTMGDETFTFYGGVSRMTGERSSITAHSIIAVKGKALGGGGVNPGPPLHNPEPFPPGPPVQRPETGPASRGSAHGAAVPALRSEQGRVPDPDEPADPRRPDGVPQAARGGAFPSGPRP